QVASSSVILRWDNPAERPGPQRVSFPVASDDDAVAFDHLLKVSEKATFGLDGRHEFDETYRKAQKLGAGDFCTTFCPYETGIIDAVCQVLLPSYDMDEDKRAIRAELYNMNIYSGPSGKFKAHVDTPRSPYQIGSLVICLPMKHEGGELAVRHFGQTHSFDWAKSSTKSVIQWAAFYSDCAHEVFEVKSGHRVTLTYNLYATAGNGDLGGQISAFSPTSLPLYKQVVDLLGSKKFQSKDRLLGVYSTHAYPHTEKEHGLPFCLKGLDMVIYNTFKSLGLEVHLCAILENPKGFRRRKLYNGEFSDEDTDAEPMQKKMRLAKNNNGAGSDSEDDDGRKYYTRTVGYINQAYSTDEQVEYRDDMKRIINEAMGTDKVKFDASKIIWLNKNNGESNMQVSYMAVGPGFEATARAQHFPDRACSENGTFPGNRSMFQTNLPCILAKFLSHVTTSMSPRICSCTLCGWIVVDAPGSVSWLNQFRGVTSSPNGVILTGVGLYDDPARGAFIAPVDLKRRWDDPTYNSISWGHDYGGASIVDNEHHFPFEDRFSDRDYIDPDPVLSANPYEAEEAHHLLTEAPEEPPSPEGPISDAAAPEPERDSFYALPEELRPETSLKTLRFNAGERINYLDIGFDGCKIVSLAIFPHSSSIARLAQDDNRLRNMGMWYPEVPGPDLCLNETSFAPREHYLDGFKPLFWTSFGGPGGAHLRTLNNIRVVLGRAGIYRIDFTYNVPELDRTFGCQMPGDLTKEIIFEIDGAGGELINAVEILQENVDPEDAYTWMVEEGFIAAFKSPQVLERPSLGFTEAR
ncbi:oxidoreductase, partial [Colletotrichum tamarilloi]